MTKRLHTTLISMLGITSLVAQLQVLPLGNSITLGSYRYDLWQMLIDEGIDFEYIGSVNSTPTSGGQLNAWPPYQGHIFNDSHEGHSGWKSYDIINGSPWQPGAGNIYNWLWGYTPDVVLLHIGTNDVTHLSAAESAEYISEIIRTLQADNPNVVVFLAKIIPREGFYNEVTALNILIDTVAENTRTATSCIHVVDQFSDFDLWADTYDGIHPDRSGDIKMAQKWTAAITAHFDDEAENCTGTASVDCSTISSNSTVNQSINCFNGSNGAITAQVLGGTPPYQYQWSNGEATASISGLSAASYTVTISDANNCQTINNLDLEEPNQLMISAAATAINFVGANNGTAEVIATGGTPPYTFEWSNGTQSPQIHQLSAGDYTVTVMDDKGCSRITTATVEDIICTGFEIILTATNGTCFGENDGQVIAQISNGQAPYELMWSNGLTDEHLWNVAAGTYFLTVTDNVGCTETTNIAVTEPSELTTFSTVLPTTCGLDNGIATVHISGGTTPYSIDWPNEAMEETLINLSAGSYEVTVVDAQGCVGLETIQVDASEDMQLDIERQPVSCFGGEDGSIDVTIVKGTAPFRYQWSDGSEVEDLQNLSAGTYSVEVKDALECQVTAIVNIDSPDELEAELNIMAATEQVGGTAKIKMSGGTAPYHFTWSHGATGQEVMNLAAGIYEVSITDVHDCLLVETVEIEQITHTTSILTTRKWTVFPNPPRDVLNIDIEFLEIQSFQIHLYNALGQVLYTENYEQDRLTTQLHVQNWNVGVYFLEIRTERGNKVKKIILTGS